jgi:hypothetical protein
VPDAGEPGWHPLHAHLRRRLVALVQSDREEAALSLLPGIARADGGLLVLQPRLSLVPERPSQQARSRRLEVPRTRGVRGSRAPDRPRAGPRGPLASLAVLPGPPVHGPPDPSGHAGACPRHRRQGGPPPRLSRQPPRGHGREHGLSGLRQARRHPGRAPAPGLRGGAGRPLPALRAHDRRHGLELVGGGPDPPDAISDAVPHVRASQASNAA